MGFFNRKKYRAAIGMTVADLKEFPKYDKIWKEIFKLR